METKYTPGPWSINDWTQRDREIRIGAVGTPLICTVEMRDVSINEHKANANLISTAPELLEALQKAKEIIERISSEYSLIAHKHSSYTNGEARIIESAIKKATGDALEKTFAEAQQRFPETLKNLDDEKI